MLEVFSFIGLLATFALAYGCDRWVEAVRAQATQSTTIASFLWRAGVANLLLASVLLLLAWFVSFRAGVSKLIPSVFILIGLVVSFAVAIEASVSSTLPPLGIIEYLTPNSHVLYAAAFVAVIGITGFVLPKRLNH